MKKKFLQNWRLPEIPAGIKSDLKYEKITVVFSLILLGLVCGTGFWVYSKLSSVTDNIAEGRTQDSRLLILQQLNNDLVTAENFAFSYRITSQDSLLTRFYLIQHKTRFKINRLRQVPANYSSYKTNIDTLESLVQRKFRTMEDLVLVQNENRVNDAMEQVIHEVRNMSRANLEKPVEAPKEEDKKERRRLFQKKLEERRLKEEREAAAKRKKAAMISSVSVNKGLQEIKKDVVEEEKAKNVRKLIVEQRNNMLSSQFTSIIQTIENQEKLVLLKEAEQAKAVARETNMIIGLFCLTSVLLILFTSYLLFLFLSKTKATTAQLIIARQKSDQLTKSKSQFLANMSHELRTPLNAIVGFTEQLKDSELSENQTNKVGIISKAADHLTRITNEILDFSKLAAGAVRLENIEFDMREELDFVVNTLNQLAEQHHNKLHLNCHEEVPGKLVGDPMRVRQIMINLVGNALKFTEKGTVTIAVKPHLQSQKETTLIISVSDTGIGISEENIARIFDEFEQAETSVTRKFGGTGLGLSITRMLVERMNGKITAASKVGKGTTFSVELPFEIAEVSEERAKTPQPSESLGFLNGHSVLVVDDEAFNRKLLRNMLEKAGAKITEAENGNIAIEALGLAVYDLVLLDLRMPEMDGFTTLKAIRKNTKTEKIPVVALSAAISQEERIAMVKDTWNGILLKPFKLNDLSKVVRKALNANLKEEKPAELAASQEEPEFTLQPLKELSGTDTDFYLDMLQTLSRTTKEGLDLIVENFNSGNYLEMAEAAHKIAAPVKHLNAATLYEILKETEIQGRSGNIEPSLRQKIGTLQKGLETVLEGIDKEISSL